MLRSRRRAPWMAAASVAVLFCGTLAGTGAMARPAPPAPSWCERTDRGYECFYGPVDVPAGESIEIMTGMAAPSEAGYLTSAQATLVDGEGEPIGHHEVHLHHAVWLNPQKEDMTCDSYDFGFPGYDRFFATGKERTKLVLPRGHGYYWDNEVSQPYTRSAPWWALVAHLDGMHGNDATYIKLRVGFQPEATATNMTDVRPVWLDVRNCTSDPVYDVPRTKSGVHRETWGYRMPVGGRFIAMAGHLHDGGLRIHVDNKTTGRRLFTSSARYTDPDEPGYLTKMTTFEGLPGRRVARGDRLRLTSVYDAGRPRSDVMGIVVGALVPR